MEANVNCRDDIHSVSFQSTYCGGGVFHGLGAGEVKLSLVVVIWTVLIRIHEIL